VILDLTTLEKTGKFKEFKHLIRVYNGKRGLHIVMLYMGGGTTASTLEFSVYRGKDTPTPTQLGLRLVRRLPKILTQHFKVLVLADTAFGSNEFVTKIRQLKHHALVGVCSIRKLADGTQHSTTAQTRSAGATDVGLKFQSVYLVLPQAFRWQIGKTLHPLHQSS
jgi:hypothetical protein